MENSPEVLRYAAFSTTPNGGNPAGLVLDARHLDETGMLAVAAAVGYAETAFVTEQGVDGDPRRGWILHLRYPCRPGRHRDSRRRRRHHRIVHGR